ncbi:MAG TPA: ABC transporter ATP-binding protein [Candidatus Limnocylindrales bacterium]|nr:ABC transporter ATP-binding protein [Candidatus Limnocylindrales bacterium]
MSQLELHGLRKTFGHVVAVDNLDLAIDRGELVSLVGPSGCGKTTTLRMVAGLEEADRGRIMLEGRDVTHEPANRRGMGVVFQSYALFPNMTAAENIAYGLAVRRRRADDVKRRVAELVDLIEIGDAAKRYPHQLSGGQQQRVALARALAIEPGVLLLDEPLSALDAAVRLTLRLEIRRIQRSLGIATMYITHDQEEALSISDRVAVMREGRIEQLGTPEQIYTSPANEYVARFVGTSNRLPVTVSAADAGAVEWRGVSVPVVADGGVATGGAAVMVVRPERVRVAPANGHDGYDGSGGTWPGTVVERTFLGAVTRLSIRVGDDVVLADLPGEATSAVRFSIEDPVRISFEPGGCRLIPASATPVELPA